MQSRDGKWDCKRGGRTEAHVAVVELDDAEAGVPRVDLAEPVLQGGDGRDDEGRLVLARKVQAAEEADELDGLAEAHLVAHDACTPPEVRAARARSSTRERGGKACAGRG